MTSSPSRLFVTVFAFLGLVSAGPAMAQATAEEVDALRGELNALRTQLAQTQLELKRALTELKQVREYQQTPDAAKQVAEWRAERERIAEQRKQLAVERRRLEQAKITLRDATANSPAPAAGPANVPPAAAEAPATGAGEVGEKPRWELDYKIGVIHTGGNYQATYIAPTAGTALVESYPLIDRRNILVRGSLQNRSTAPWRYTFEVRIGGRDGQIIGRWRHQTEVLGPNELAAFDLKVPVSNVADITTYQIGNIEADRPPQTAPGDAPEAPRERERVNR